MRTLIGLIMLLMAAALGVCAMFSRQSEKEIAPKVTNLLISLLPPVIGNFLITVAITEELSVFGRYMYMVGIDLTMYALLDFVLLYCGLKWRRSLHTLVIGAITVDIVQILCNPFTGHVFAPDVMEAYGAPYYNVKSYIGRNLHLGLVYILLGASFVILLVKMFRAPRIYSEKYSLILLLLVGTGIWEMFYLFSRTPVKRTVIAYGMFGLLVYYFSLLYRPVRMLDHLLANVTSGLTDALFFFDDSQQCVWADEHGLRMVDLDEHNLGHCVNRLNELFPGLRLDQSDWRCQRTLGERYFNLVKHTVLDSGGRLIGSFLVLQDETEQQKAFQKERYLAHYDSLTGLYRKQYLMERIRERLDAHPERKYYVAYLDINNFKMINDVFGSEFGDHVLSSLAESLREKLPPDCLYGRLGGDVFGICLNDQEFDPELAELNMSSFTVIRDNISQHLEIHQGVYEVTDPSLDVSLMFDRAHMALDTIKNDFKRHVAIYDEKMREKVLMDQQITLEVPEAIVKRQIRPYLQAIVDRDERVIGAEALVRWIHPEKGYLSPSSFIPTVEQYGMIADVDRYMWRCACEILNRWKKMGRDDLFISINVSPKDFFFMDVLEELKAIVREYNVSPSHLRVEITETVMMNDEVNRLTMLRSMQECGFLVEMDDFGSGYSSLNMLKDMPVDIIKIDMMFLHDMKAYSRTTTILRNVINMMIELGLVPLTEGVETPEQYQMLASMGCKLFQGFLFARPMPVEEFEETFICPRRNPPAAEA